MDWRLEYPPPRAPCGVLRIITLLAIALTLPSRSFSRRVDYIISSVTPDTELQIYDVTMDQFDNIYYVERTTCSVFRIDGRDRTLSTVAGTGSCELIDVTSPNGAPSTSVGMRLPFALAISTDGRELIVSEFYGFVVRKVDIQAGTMSRFAGKPGVRGFDGDGGPASEALFSAPYAIWLDDAGNSFIGDFWNDCIRRVDGETGIISSILLGEDVHPSGIWGDAAGNLYVAVRDAMSILQVYTEAIEDEGEGESAQPQEQKLSGPKYSTRKIVDGSALSARPHGICVDAVTGSIFFSDYYNRMIYQAEKISSSSSMLPLLASTEGESRNNSSSSSRGAGEQAGGPDGAMSGQELEEDAVESEYVLRGIVGKSGVAGYSGDGGPASEALIAFPGFMHCSAKTGDVYFPDRGENHVLRKLSERRFEDHPSLCDSMLQQPTPPSSSSSSSSLPSLAAASSCYGVSTEAVHTESIWDVSLDSADNLFFTTDADCRLFVKERSSGRAYALAGNGMCASSSTGSTSKNSAKENKDNKGTENHADRPTEIPLEVPLNIPLGVWAHPNGKEVYFAEFGNHVVRKLTLQKKKELPPGAGRGGGGGAQTDVSDYSASRLEVYAGTPGVAGYSGDGGDARIAQMGYVSFLWGNEKTGELIVGDGFSNTLRKITPPDATTTAGSSSSGGGIGEDGEKKVGTPAPTSAHSSGPIITTIAKGRRFYGVWGDEEGNIYAIADSLTDLSTKGSSHGEPMLPNSRLGTYILKLSPPPAAAAAAAPLSSASEAVDSGADSSDESLYLVSIIAEVPVPSGNMIDFLSKEGMFGAGSSASSSRSSITRSSDSNEVGGLSEKTETPSSLAPISTQSQPFSDRRAVFVPSPPVGLCAHNSPASSSSSPSPSSLFFSDGFANVFEVDVSSGSISRVAGFSVSNSSSGRSGRSGNTYGGNIAVLSEGEESEGGMIEGIYREDSLRPELEQGYSGDGGPAIGARMFRPYGMHCGKDGSLYVAEVTSRLVRKLHRSGTSFPSPSFPLEGEQGSAALLEDSKAALASTAGEYPVRPQAWQMNTPPRYVVKSDPLSVESRFFTAKNIPVGAEEISSQVSYSFKLNITLHGVIPSTVSAHQRAQLYKQSGLPLPNGHEHELEPEPLFTLQSQRAISRAVEQFLSPPMGGNCTAVFSRSYRLHTKSSPPSFFSLQPSTNTITQQGSFSLSNAHRHAVDPADQRLLPGRISVVVALQLLFTTSGTSSLKNHYLNKNNMNNNNEEFALSPKRGNTKSVASRYRELVTGLAAAVTNGSLATALREESYHLGAEETVLAGFNTGDLGSWSGLSRSGVGKGLGLSGDGREYLFSVGPLRLHVADASFLPEHSPYAASLLADASATKTTTTTGRGSSSSGGGVRGRTEGVDYSHSLLSAPINSLVAALRTNDMSKCLTHIQRKCYTSMDNNGKFLYENCFDGFGSNGITQRGVSASSSYSKKIADLSIINFERGSKFVTSEGTYCAEISDFRSSEISLECSLSPENGITEETTPCHYVTVLKDPDFCCPKAANGVFR